MFEYLTEDIDLKDENFFFKTIKSLITLLTMKTVKSHGIAPSTILKSLLPRKNKLLCYKIVDSID